MNHELPELRRLETLIDRHASLLRSDQIASVQLNKKQTLPVYAIELGSQSPTAPTIAFIGGVHGKERIGSQVVIAWLQTLLDSLSWDRHSQSLVEQLRVVFIPIVNPGGMANGTRSNPNGVDLMRNAPVEAEARTPWPLGGHRIGPWVPWYRGDEHEPMELEAQALCDTIRKRLLQQPFSIALDCHSGFGAQNRIWFPYARSCKRIPHLADVYELRNLFRNAYPNHIHYRIEPQSSSYTTHGDLWDYLYDESLQQDSGIFLPLTLEMGSWLWMRQHPARFLRQLDIFNPPEQGLQKRILRQHLVWFDFLMRACLSHDAWRPLRKKPRKRSRKQAKTHWPKNQ